MDIVPSAGSTSRKRDTPIEDFPEPVLPTMPIFSFALMLHVMPFKTSGKFSLYRIWKKGRTTVILLSFQGYEVEDLTTDLQCTDRTLQSNKTVLEISVNINNVQHDLLSNLL